MLFQCYHFVLTSKIFIFYWSIVFSHYDKLSPAKLWVYFLVFAKICHFPLSPFSPNFLRMNKTDSWFCEVFYRISGNPCIEVRLSQVSWRHLNLNLVPSSSSDHPHFDLWGLSWTKIDRDRWFNFHNFKQQHLLYLKVS